MAKIIKDLEYKTVLETYFGIKDIHKLLNAFNLPINGRKPDLIRRVLSLIDEKSYDREFVIKVKYKIDAIYNKIADIEEMAPNVGSFIRDSVGVKKRGRKKSVNKSKNYESDDSFVVGDSSVSEDSDVSPNMSTVSSDDFIVSDDNSNHKQKKRTVIKPKSSSESSSSESSSSDKTNKYRTRAVRKEKNKRKLSQNNNYFNKKKSNKSKEYISSSSEEESHSEPQLITKKVKTRNRIPINVILSSSSSDEEENVVNDDIHMEEDDDEDDIQFLESVPASRSTINRFDFQPKNNDSSSTDTESTFNSVSSDSDMDVNDINDSITEFGQQLESLVTDSSNCVNVCDKTVTLSPTVLPEIQNQSIVSEIINQMNSSVNQTEVTENPTEPQIQSTDNISMSDVSIESITLSPDSPIIITNEVKSNDSNVKKEMNCKQNSTTVQQKEKIPPKEVSVDPKEEVIVRPPEPQRPHTFISVMSVKTPTDKPHATTLWKNGQAIHVPPPPQLDSFISFRVIAPTETINGIKKRLNNDSDEIEAIDQTLKISLNCPITNKRVVTPCRSCYCHHFDCFDINSFLGINYNKRIENWKCPKCKQPAQRGQLIIDSLLQHILKHPSVADPTVESVIFDNKALWIPDIKSQEIFINKNSDNNNVINILDSNSDEIIELDDDDDDETTPTPTVSAPNLSMPNFSETMAAAISVASNVTNLIQSNQKNVNKSGTPNVNELINTNTMIAPTNTRTNTRWSGPTVNTNTVQQRNDTQPTNPPNITIRIANGVQQIIAQNVRPISGQQTNKQINRQQSGQQISGQNIGQQSNQQSNRQQSVPQNNSGQQVIGQNNRQNNGQRNNQQNNRQQNVPQNSVQQNRTQPQQPRQFIAISMPNTTPRVTANPPSNTNPSTGSGSEFKFNFANNSVSVYCYSCNETFDNTLLEQHKNNPVHIKKSNQNSNNSSNVPNSNQSSTTNRSTVQTHRPPVRAHTNNNYRNTVPNYNNNSNNYRYQQQYTNPSATYSTQLIQPYITNNYYPHTAQYMPQMAPPAHQTPVNSVYSAPIYPPYPGPPNQSNTYYPNY